MRTFSPLPEEIERAGTGVVDAAYKVHKALGPGLLESVYEACLTHEIRQRGFLVVRHLKLASKPLGFLINFNVPVIKQGITRMRL